MSDSLSFDVQPILPSHALPVDQRTSASRASAAVHLLSSLEKEFEAAVDLMSFAQGDGYAAPMGYSAPPTDKSGKWSFIAARSGAMTISGFERTLAGISGNLNKAQTLQTVLDTKAFREARSNFRKGFPSHRELRDAVAHRAEFRYLEFDNHSTKDGLSQFSTAGFSFHPEGLAWGESLFRRTYTIINNGKAVSYDLNAASLGVFAETRKEVWKIFREAYDVVARKSK